MGKRGVSSKTVIGIIALILALAVFGGVYVFDKIKTDKETEDLRQKMDDQRAAQRVQDEKIVGVLTELKSSVTSDIPRIVCWGDEYTLGASKNSVPFYLSNKLNEELFFTINEDLATTAYLSSYSINLTVRNNGIFGEDLYTMAAHTGAYPLCIKDALELPKGTGNTQVSFITKGDRPVEFVPQTDIPFGNTTIDGVEGTIELEKIADSEYKYYFSKNAASDPQTIAARTRVYTSLSTSYSDDVLVLFFGREYNEIDDLVNIQRRLVNNRENNKDKFVVVSMTNKGTKLDTAMVAEFGDNYLRVDVPGDGSFNSLNVAEAVYQKMDDLGYFNGIKTSVTNAENEIKKIREG